MTAKFKKRIISALIAVSVVFSLIPSGMNLKSTGATPSKDDIGAIAYINDDDFPLSSDPIQRDGTGSVYHVKKSELPEKVVITDFYYNENEQNSEPLYKIDATTGYSWNEKYRDYHWIEAKSVVIIYNEDAFILDSAGDLVDGSVDLPQYNKVSLFAKSSLKGELTYQWQICYDRARELFADIQGDTDAQFDLTYGKVYYMLDHHRTAQVRCLISNGEKIAYSDVITVNLLLYTNDNGYASDVSNYANSISAYSLASYGVNTLDAGSAKTTHTVTVTYKFENGETASDNFTAKIADGETFNRTVTFPTVEGYLPYVNDEPKDSLTFSGKVTEDITVEVIYKPTNVNYTVIYYKQNLVNDEYTEAERETLQGLTGEQIPEITKTYEGFYSLLYERPTIAANGSTVIEIYFDRYYYLINFDMDGGYGTDPVYTLYDAPVPEIPNPQKAGYTFLGWAETKGETDQSKAVEIPETMPAYADGSKTYYAIWKVCDTAKVTIVFWGENANDEQYSYLSDYTKEIYLKPGKEFTYSETGMLTCGKDTHTHTDDCYEFICNTEAHEHNGDCYTCGNTEHKHSVGCYEGASSEIPDGASAPWDAPSSPKNGQVFIETHIIVTRKYIYINGSWYNYSGSVANGSTVSPNCGMTDHTHTTACIGCGKTEHIHKKANCYKLTCEKEEHNHTASCYEQGAGLDSTKWKFVKSDTVTVEADGSTVCNVYYDRVEYSVQFYNNQSCSTTGGGSFGGSSNKEYTDLKITAKWGENILNKWPNYNGSSSWYVKDKSNTWQNSIQVMPVGGAKFWGPKSGNSKYTATYYVEILDGEKYDVKGSDGRYYKVHHTDTSNSSGSVTDEERYGIEGFTINNSISTLNGSSYGGSKFYYTRNSYNLTFNDGYSDIKQESVKYEAPLASFKDYVPEIPSIYEPNSVQFAGWYQNPQCTGEEFKLDKHTMPANDLILYAKWVPVTHTVKFFLTEDDLAKGNVYNPDPNTESNATFNNIPHGDYIAQDYVDNHLTKQAMVEAKPRGNYTFVIWYYYDNGVKKYFDPAMQIRKDLDLIAEWSSDSFVKYTVQYVLKDDPSVKVADDTVGSGRAGTTKTFDAKGGNDLYTPYRQDYYPTLKSQSVILDIDEDNIVITFEYVYGEGPYTVRYVTDDADADKSKGTVEVDGKTYTRLADDKDVSDNRYAVVTETFVPVSGYVPDAYQKRLVVSSTEENVLYFFYTRDEVHAYYQITHKTQNADGTYSVYASSQSQGDIGKYYTGSPMDISGYHYTEIKYYVNGTQVADSEITHDGVKLTSEGLSIELYYVPNDYPYQVRYLEQGTGIQLHEPKNGTGKYGQTVTESAIDIKNYTKVDPTSATVSIRIEEDNVAKLNIITFYYTENTVTLNYAVVSGSGTGTVTPQTETFKVATGSAQGSIAIADSGSRFVGWFYDSACTSPVPSTWVNTSDRIVPQKPADGWVNGTTYYAKFERSLAELTVTKDFEEGTAIDREQVFVFNVVGTDTGNSTVNITVTVQGKGSVKVSDLPIGNYKVTEITDWSWRYIPVGDTEQSVYLDGNKTVTFTNKLKDGGDKWLDHNASANNVFNKNN